MKQHPSAFTGTDLNVHLEKLGKKKIVLAGVYAFVCWSYGWWMDSSNLEF